MDIEQAKADLKKRQEALAQELQSIDKRRGEIIHEITMNNGEARLLKNLSDNGQKK